MRIAHTDYWSIKTEAEWQGALDATPCARDCEKPRAGFEGPGIYYIECVMLSLSLFEISSQKFSSEEVQQFTEEAQALAAVARLWQQLTEEEAE